MKCLARLTEHPGSEAGPNSGWLIFWIWPTADERALALRKEEGMTQLDGRRGCLYLGC